MGQTSKSKIKKALISIRKISLLIVLGLCLSHCTDTNSAPEAPAPPAIAITPIDTFPLQIGDLLFQDSDCGPFCDAIEKVTHGINGAKFSHVGLVVKDPSNRLQILEAIGRGVVLTPIDSFLMRSADAQQQPKVIVGRLKEEYQHLLNPAVQAAISYLGQPYDPIFDLNNEAYYCSEMLYFAFKTANNNQPVFQLRPMTFKDPDTGETFPAWLEHFQSLQKFIPENKPGLNPGSMSRSLYLDIVHYYGQPTGMRSSTPG